MDLKELQRNWELFGRTDPLRAILTGPPTSEGWQEDEFFRTGRADIDAAFAVLDRIGAKPGKGRALDFGCGVGRLTQSLCARFDSVLGLDIAPAMIDLARRYNRFGERCEYAVNDRDDLSRLRSRSFDFVYSLIVLQHMRPEYSSRYIREFMRIAAPGGIIVFQLPAAAKTHSVAALPREAFAAQIELVRPIDPMSASRRTTVFARVTNRSSHPWAQPAPDRALALNLGNHWRDRDGRMLKLDDGRTPVPLPLGPGATAEIELSIMAPATAGTYELELDLVQESVCWFAQRNSPVLKCLVDVGPNSAVQEPAQSPAASETPPAQSGPKMEMYCVPRRTVERLIRRGGGRILTVIPHHGAGPDYENYQYFVEMPRHGRRLRKGFALARAALDRMRARLVR